MGLIMFGIIAASILALFIAIDAAINARVKFENKESNFGTRHTMRHRGINLKFPNGTVRRFTFVTIRAREIERD